MVKKDGIPLLRETENGRRADSPEASGRKKNGAEEEFGQISRAKRKLVFRKNRTILDFSPPLPHPSPPMLRESRKNKQKRRRNPLSKQ
ncbi:MAG: hypothetical protein ACI3YC_07525 [Alloprevotella sp.]